MRREERFAERKPGASTPAASKEEKERQSFLKSEDKVNFLLERTSREHKHKGKGSLNEMKERKKGQRGFHARSLTQKEGQKERVQH